MSGYSLMILICAAALSRSECQPNTATDVVRGPDIDNAIMCGLNAQTMIAGAGLLQPDRQQYMKVVCTPPGTQASGWLTCRRARPRCNRSDSAKQVTPGRAGRVKRDLVLRGELTQTGTRR